ncbi:MAG TPA: tetratricopeptide repeat protein [Pyrinomonadaceae bacterium]
MNPKSLSIVILSAAIGLIGGFILANSMNRGELTALRSENEQLKKLATSQPDANSSLTEEELKTAIDRADQSPTDAAIQRNVGVAIYRYGAMKEDVRLLQQAIRILDRALELKPDDYDVVLTLGNAHFDIGYFSKDNQSLERAREFYSKALSKKPDDVNVRTDVGLTYFLETPPDLERSVIEFRRSLALDPKHEKTLQFITQALARQNKITEASTYLEQLRSVNPRNESISGLASMLTAQQPAG